MGSIEEHAADMMRAYEAREYRKALRGVRAAHAEHPEAHGKTFFWIACLQSLLGAQADAVEALEDGLAEGLWWGPKTLDEEHDLDPVRSVPQFLEVRAECALRHRRARAEAQPECMAVRPPPGTEPRGVLMAVHWRGDNSVDFLSRFRHLADREGWILLLPQSSQPVDRGTFGWDDAERGREELSAHWDEFFAMEGRTFPRRIVAGASQGGRLAFELAQRKAVPYLAMIPSFPRGYKPAPGPTGTFTRGVFLLGEKDPANARTWSVYEELEAAGADVSVRTMKGTGHDFAPDFTGILGEALADLA